MNKIKIGIIFIGAIRDALPIIKQSILTLKNSLNKDKYDIDIIFSTWNPKQGEYIYPKQWWGKNYVYDYNINLLYEQIKNIVDVEIFLDQPDIEWYPQCKNGSPPIFVYHLLEIAKYIKDKNLKYDYIIKTRHDDIIKINNIEKYLNNNINIPPLYWYQQEFKTIYPSDAKNDHFFITSFDSFIKFLELKDEIIRKECIRAWDNEHLNQILLEKISTISLIDDSDILEYFYWGRVQARYK